MSNFYKEYEWVRVCVECGINFRSKRSDPVASSGRCYACRKAHIRKYYLAKWRALSKEEKSKIAKNRYIARILE